MGNPRSVLVVFGSHVTVHEMIMKGMTEWAILMEKEKNQT